MIFTPDRKGCEYKEYACKEYPQLNCEGYQEPVVINIKTDKKIYPLGQTVKITVTNDGTKTATFSNAALGLKIKNLETGKIFSFGAADVITYLTPGESKTFDWNQQDVGGKQSQSGTYSVSVGSGASTAKTTFKIGSSDGVVGGKGPNAGKFIVIVKVTNKGPNDEKGGVYIRIDDTDISKSLYGVIFPAKKTVTKTFEFNGDDVPVGTGFTVTVDPNNGNSVSSNGKNTPASKPEQVNLTIGQSKPGEGKFRVIVKVTNTATVDDNGQITVSINDNGPIQYQHPIFPAKTTIAKSFDFNAKDVPIGKGFFAEVRYGDDFDKGKQGVNTAKQGPETVEFRIP